VIAAEIRRKMGEIAKQVRALLPGYRGCVEFHFSADPKKQVLVDMKLCDVTRAKT